MIINLKNTFLSTILLFGFGFNYITAAEAAADTSGADEEANAGDNSPAAADNSATTTSSSAKGDIDANNLTNELLSFVSTDAQSKLENLLRIYLKRSLVAKYLLDFADKGLSEVSILRMQEIFCKGNVASVDAFLKFTEGLVDSVPSNNSLNIDDIISPQITKLVIDYFRLLQEKALLEDIDFNKVPNAKEIKNPQIASLVANYSRLVEEKASISGQTIEVSQSNKQEQVRKIKERAAQLTKKDTELQAAQKAILDVKARKNSELEAAKKALLDIIYDQSASIPRASNIKFEAKLNEYPFLIRAFIMSFGQESAKVVEQLFRLNKLNLTGQQRSYVEDSKNSTKYLGRLFFNVYMDLVIMKVCITMPEDKRKPVIQALVSKFLPYITEKNELGEVMYPQLRKAYPNAAIKTKTAS